MRKTFFDDMVRQLDNALDRGSPNLIYKKTQEIRDAVYIYSEFIPGLVPEHNLSIEVYDRIFNELEKLKWLKLKTSDSQLRQ